MPSDRNGLRNPTLSRMRPTSGIHTSRKQTQGSTPMCNQPFAAAFRSIYGSFQVNLRQLSGQFTAAFGSVCGSFCPGRNPGTMSAASGGAPEPVLPPRKGPEILSGGRQAGGMSDPGHIGTHRRTGKPGTWPVGSTWNGFRQGGKGGQAVDNSVKKRSKRGRICAQLSITCRKKCR